MNRQAYKSIDVASPEIPVLGPHGEPITSLPILSVLERDKCVGELARNLGSKQLLPVFHLALNSILRGLAAEVGNQPKAMALFQTPSDLEHEDVVEYIQLASRVVHGEHADVIHFQATSYAAALALICDAARAGRPVILVGSNILKLTKLLDTMDPLGKALLEDALADKQRVIDGEPMKDFIFTHLLMKICDVLEGKTQSSLSFLVPARPDLGVSTDRPEHLENLFRSPREEFFDHTQIPFPTLIAFVDTKSA